MMSCLHLLFYGVVSWIRARMVLLLCPQVIRFSHRAAYFQRLIRNDKNKVSLGLSIALCLCLLITIFLVSVAESVRRWDPRAHTAGIAVR